MKLKCPKCRYEYDPREATKDQAINITDPIYCELQEFDGRFVLEIHSPDHLVRLHFDR